MKKRILALALAGTTAFSVFGAAMSANAASSHVVYGNDPYTSYKSATVRYANNTGYINTVTGKVVANNGLDVATHLNQGIKFNTLNEAVFTNKAAALTAMGYREVTTNVYQHTILPYAGVDPVFATETYWSTVPTGLSATDVVLPADAAGVPIAIANPSATKAYNKLGDAVYGKVYFDNELGNEITAYVKANYANEISELYTAASGKTVTVNPQYSYKYSYAYGDGALVVDELSRDGVTVENGNVYAYDFYTSAADVAAFAGAWNKAAFVRKDTNLVSSGDVDALVNVIRHITGQNDTILDEDNAVTGRGGYNYARADVVNEYEDFLVEIGLADYNADGTLSFTVADLNHDRNTNDADIALFMSMYSYEYGTNDEYNFTQLVKDLYATVAAGDGNYVNLPSSNLVYLMQQYDKYVDGSYIGEKEVGESRWAELLIEALSAVDASDFRSNAYNTFKRNADAAIGAYENAANTVQQKAAIDRLYDAVVSAFGPSAGADKTELAASLNGLYFNNKNIPAVYMDKAVYNSNNAELVLYAYDGYKQLLDSLMAPHFAYNNATTGAVKAVYPVYPMTDYIDYDTTTPNTVYTGNKTDAAFAGALATGDYEWFWNVYQLATTINSKANNTSYQGIIDTVNNALNEAAADLAPVNAAKASASLRLEEAVEANEAAVKEEADYLAKYYNAYTKGVEIAENAEGAMQTAYAIEIAITSGTALSYQSTQTTVTKGMIADLKTAIKNAETALKALKADKEQYNAAQAVALTNAIDNANKYVKLYDGTYHASSALYQSVNKGYSKLVGDKDQMVISDVTNAIEDINAAIEFKNVIQGWSKNAAGKDMYGTEDGYLNNTSGTNKDGWVKIRSGEIVDDKAPGQWYKFTEDGTIYTSYWLKENGKDYYLKADGAAAIGWAKIDNQWYYFGGDCAMKTGWVKSGGNWYYLSTADSTKGEMVTGWAEIGGKWYYFSKEENAVGQMLYNTTTPDGYKVNEDGVWVK